MFQIVVNVRCPHCQSPKVVKNGVKKTGCQNLLCRSCHKQFQHEYLYQGADPVVKTRARNMLLRGSSLQDCKAVLGISPRSTLAWLFFLTSKLSLKPSRRHYEKVIIDEFWSFVQKKKNKVWLIYAYAPQNDEILAFVLGKRDGKTVRKLMQQLKQLSIDWFCTDNWEAFKKELPYWRHLIGKHFTRPIEGINTAIRTFVRRVFRRTTCFSKKLENHCRSLILFFYHRNNHLPIIHS